MKKLTADTLAHLEKLSTVSRAKSFLGREFLTWLWYQTEVTANHISVIDPDTGEKSSLYVWIDDRIVLEAEQGMAHVHTLRGGSPSQSHEATTALLNGKSAKEVKIGIRLEPHGDFTAVIKAPDLHPRSLKLPEIAYQQDDDGEESLIEWRLRQSKDFMRALDQLFRAFMDERMDNAWTEEKMPRINSWIRQREQKGVALLH